MKIKLTQLYKDRHRLIAFITNILVFFPLSHSFAQHTSKEKIVNDRTYIMLNACEVFVNTYTPVYYYNTDTFVVARFKPPPDSINIFLHQCVKNKNYKALKYCAAIIIRHNEEYIKKNKQDYIISDGLILGDNGFISLLLSAMNIEEKFYDENNPSKNYVLYTSEICKWIREKNKTIADYSYVLKYRQRVKKLGTH